MATTAVDVFQLVGATLDAKFAVERVVAEGGFGVVYRARHVLLDRPVALKVLKTPGHFNDEARAAFVAAFIEEARTVVRISHPHIVQVLDFGVVTTASGAEAPWMALEWLEGRTLAEELAASRGRGGRPAGECLALLRPVIEALAYIHEEGFAHRDVKPANMMLVGGGKRGPVVKLLDFGIAKRMLEGEEAGTGETRTASTLQAFSLAYAAPEQIGGARTGPWTDVHALGLILSEMLTGAAPYDGASRTEMFADALSPRRPTPAKRAVDVGAWEFVLARALALRPADRFASAGELLAALESALAPDALPPRARAATPARAPVAPPSPRVDVAIGALTGPDGLPVTTMRGAAHEQPVEAVPPGAPRRGRGAVVAGIAALALLVGVGSAAGVRLVQRGGAAHAGGAVTRAAVTAPRLENAPRPVAMEAPRAVAPVERAEPAVAAQPPQVATDAGVAPQNTRRARRVRARVPIDID